jgi:hypothetical protein
MRRIVSSALALLLVVIGGGSLVYLLLFATGWKGWMVIGAGFIAAAGAVWLYDDFSNPAPTPD